MKRISIHWLLCTLWLTVPSAHDSLALGDDKPQETKGDQVTGDEERLVTTQHTVVINGRQVNYTATAGKLEMQTDRGDEKAYMFFVAYHRADAGDLQQRPITFAFNGGPGSSSVWLHLGMLGPKRIKLPDDASPLRPPYRLDANPHSLLDITDLVFIDPVSTGYSRPAKDEKKEQFHGYEEDLRSVGQFIHDYTTRFHRWTAPKFLIGESYGGMRAAGLSGHLQDRYRMELSGVVLVSAAVNFQTLRFSTTNYLPNILFLPSYTATAWYHRALPGDLQQLELSEVVRQAEQFALNEYALALLQGTTSLSETRRQAVAEKLARYTGLPKQYVENSNLRISMNRFGKELLRGRGRTIGRFDSRYTGIDRDNAGERYEYDASGAAIFGPFTAALNDYVRRDLNYEDDRVYEILTGNVHPWSYGSFENRYVDSSETLRQAMTANPHLKLFVACGHYDLATPPSTMVYTVNHLQLAPELRENVTLRFYEAGHMMYVHEPSMRQLREDLLKFYESAIPASGAKR